jgi:integrase
MFKTGPITRVINSLYRNQQILTFYGIRKSESVSRSKYNRVEDDAESVKIQQQTVASPIFFWKDLDIWLYMLAEEVDFNEAYRLGDISFNPFLRIQMFCSDTKTKGIFTEDEIRKLFKSTSSKCLWKNDLTYLFNLLAVSTGMRLGEIQALRVEDLSKGLITVRHSYDVKYGLKETKTNTVRQIPISMELYKSILKFLSWRNNGYIFSFNNGVTPISRNYIYKDFYSAMKKIGLSRNELNERNISFHSYRHTFASILANKNLPELFIRKLTGHASQEVFNGYTHIELEELQKALA